MALVVLADADMEGGAAPAVTQLSTTIARLDQLWQRRDESAALAEHKSALSTRRCPERQRLWVAVAGGALYFWLSDDPRPGTGAERTRMGKYGWDLAERAVAINPNDVAGHFWAVGGMGNYSLGLGVVRALTQRIEGKFRDRISRAEQLDPGYAYGGIPLAWGRYYAKLPWPKYDEKKARANYARALQINPNNLRARVFLAELMLEEDEPAGGQAPAGRGPARARRQIRRPRGETSQAAGHPADAEGDGQELKYATSRAQHHLAEGEADTFVGDGRLSGDAVAEVALGLARHDEQIARGQLERRGAGRRACGGAPRCSRRVAPNESVATTGSGPSSGSASACSPMLSSPLR